MRAAAAELDRLTESGGRAENSLKKFGGAAVQADRSLKGMLGSLRGLQTLLTTVAASLVVRKLLDYADAWTRVTGQLNFTATSTEHLARVQEDVFRIAQSTRGPLGETATLYSRLSASAKDLGASQADIVRVVGIVNKSLVVNSTTTASARGALLQLSQAFGGATIQAQEYNSLIDGARPLLQAAANGIEATGGSVNKLTQLVRDGQISNTEFFQGILKGGATVNEQFTKMGVTVASAMTVIDNSLLALVGRLNENAGATELLANAMLGLSTAIDSIDISTAILELREWYDLALQVIQVFETLGRFVKNPPKQIAEALGFGEAPITGLTQLREANQKAIDSIKATQAATAQLNAAFGAYAVSTQRTAGDTAALKATFEQLTAEGAKLDPAFRGLATELGLYAGEAKGAAGATGALAEANDKAAKAAEKAAKTAATAAEQLTKAYQDQLTGLQDLIGLRKLQVTGVIDAAEAELRLQKTQNTREFGPERAAQLDEEARALAGLNTELEQNGIRQNAANSLAAQFAAGAAAHAQEQQNFISATQESTQELEAHNEILRRVEAGTLDARDADVTYTIAQVQLETETRALAAATDVEAEAIRAAGLAKQNAILANNALVTSTQQVAAAQQQAAKSSHVWSQVLGDLIVDTLRTGSTALKQIAGVGNSIGTQLGSSIGGGLGTALGTALGGGSPLGGAIGNIVGEFLGSLVGDLLGDLFKPGRIALEKQGIHDFFEEAIGLKALKKFSEEQGESFAELENSLHGLGVAYANFTDGGIGTIKRFANVVSAAMNDNNLTLKEAQAVAVKLAEELGLTLVGAIEELNEAMDSLRGVAGDLDLAELLEERSEGQKDIILIGDLLEGIIDLFSNYSEAVDAVVLANGFMADSFEAAAVVAGFTAAEVATFTDQIRAGTLEIEDALLQLNALGGITIGLNEIEIDAKAIEKEITRIFADVTDIATAAGAVWGEAAVAAAGGAIVTAKDIQKAFAEAIRAALFDRAVTEFIEARLPELLAGFDFSAPIDLSSEAFQALAKEVGLVGEELVKLLETLNLMPDAIRTMGEIEIQVRGAERSAAGFADPSGIREQANAIHEAAQQLRRDLQDLQDTLEEGSVQAERVRQARIKVIFAEEAQIDTLVQESLSPLQDFISTSFGPKIKEQIAALDIQMLDYEATLQALEAEHLLSADAAEEYRARLAAARDEHVGQLVQESLQPLKDFIDTAFGPSVEDQIAALDLQMLSYERTLQDLESAHLLSAEAADEYRQRLAAARDVQAQQIEIDSIPGVRVLVPALKNLGNTLGQSFAAAYIAALEKVNFNPAKLNFNKLGAELERIMNRAAFDAVTAALFDAFITAPVNVIVQSLFGALVGPLITAGLAGGAAFAGAVIGATNQVIDALKVILPVLKEVLQSPELQAFLRDLDLGGGGAGASAGGGGGGGGGGGASGEPAFSSITNLEEFLAAIRKEIRAFADDSAPSLVGALKAIREEAEVLADALTKSILEEARRAAAATFVRRPGDGAFTSSPEARVAIMEAAARDLFETLAELAENMAARMTKAIQDQLRPANDFLHSLDSQRSGFVQLIEEYNAANESIDHAAASVADLVDVQTLYDAVNAQLAARITALISEVLAPLDEQIKKLLDHDPRPLGEVLGDLAGAQTFEAVQELQDEVLAAFEKMREDARKPLEDASKDRVKAIEEERDAELKSIEERRKAATKAIEEQIASLQKIRDFLADIPTVIANAKQALLGVLGDFSALLADIAQTESLEELQKLQAEGITLITNLLNKQKQAAEAASRERIQALEKEQQLEQEVLEDRINSIDRLIDLQRQEVDAKREAARAQIEAAQSLRATLASLTKSFSELRAAAEAATQDRIQALQEEHQLIADGLTERVGLLEKLLGLQRQEIDEKRAAAHEQIQAARSLRENLFDEKTFGATSALTGSQQFAQGLKEITALAQKITGGKGTAEDIARFEALIAPLRDVNKELFAGTTKGIAQGGRLNDLIVTVANSLEKQGKTTLKQTGGVEGTNTRLDEIRELEKELNLKAGATVKVLEQLRDQTNIKLLASQETLTKAIGKEEAALEQTKKELEKAALAELRGLQGQFAWLAKKITEGRGTADDIAKFEGLIGPINELNLALFGETAKGVRQGLLLNDIVKTVADSLEEQGKETLRQLEGVKGTNTRLDDIRELEKELNIKAGTSEETLQKMRDKLSADIIASQEALAEAIAKEEAALKATIESLEEAAIAQLTALEKALTEQAKVLVAAIDEGELTQKLEAINATFAAEEKATRDAFAVIIKAEQDALTAALQALDVSLAGELTQIRALFAARLATLSTATVAATKESGKSVVDTITVKVAPLLQTLVADALKQAAHGQPWWNANGVSAFTRTMQGLFNQYFTPGGATPVVLPALPPVFVPVTPAGVPTGGDPYWAPPDLNPPGYDPNAPLGAAHGLHTTVRRNELPILAHRGEQVDIWTAAETAQMRQHRPQSSVAPVINITIHAAPGMNERTLADKVIHELGRRQKNLEVR